MDERKHPGATECAYLQESSIFMRGLVRMGVLGSDGTVWGDWGGVRAGEEREGLPSASFPFSLCTGGGGGSGGRVWQVHATETHTNENQKCNKIHGERKAT